MARSSVSVHGMAEVRAQLRRADKGVDTGAEEGEAVAAGIVASRWRALAAVRTGAYKRSIDVQDSNEAGTGISYAPYVEHGTRYMDAQPAGGPAADQFEAQADDVFSASVRKHLPRRRR